MTEKIQKKMTSKINFNNLHLFTKKGQILESKNMQSLKQAIKENIQPPKQNKTVWVVNFSIGVSDQYPFKISVGQYTITPSLALVTKPNDHGQTFTYTKEQLEYFGFNESVITKIIDKFNNISFGKLTVPITDVLGDLKIEADIIDMKFKSDVPIEYFNPIYLWYNGKPVLEAVNLTKLKFLIKENIQPPKEDKKVFIVSYSFKDDRDKPLKFIVTQYILTPKLSLISRDDDITQTFTYTPDELKKYGFKLTYVKDIINTIKSGSKIFKKMNVSIAEALTEPKEEKEVIEEPKPMKIGKPKKTKAKVEPKPKRQKKLKIWFKATPVPEGYRLASMEEAISNNKVFYWGISQVNKKLLEQKKPESKDSIIIKVAGLFGKLGKLKKEIETEKDVEIKKNKIAEYDALRKEIVKLNEKLKST